MGGYRSGKDTTEEYLAIDVRMLHRKGSLRPGSQFTLTWSYNGTRTAAIEGFVKQDSVVLSYRHRRPGSGEWIPKKYPVQLVWTPCHYGGQRPWFICPARGCGRRVAVLYGGEVYACRHCYQLAYESQREGDCDRQLRRAQEIRMRLGGTGSMAEDFPEKPKGMHWSTYERLRARYKRYEQSSFRGLAARFGWNL